MKRNKSTEASVNRKTANKKNNKFPKRLTVGKPEKTPSSGILFRFIASFRVNADDGPIIDYSENRPIIHYNDDGIRSSRITARQSSHTPFKNKELLEPRKPPVRRKPKSRSGRAAPKGSIQASLFEPERHWLAYTANRLVFDVLSMVREFTRYFGVLYDRISARTFLIPSDRPPKLADALVCLFLSKDDALILLGDLIEDYKSLRKDRGDTLARIWYWRQAVATTRPALRRWGIKMAKVCGFGKVVRRFL